MFFLSGHFLTVFIHFFPRYVFQKILFKSAHMPSTSGKTPSKSSNFRLQVASLSVEQRLLVPQIGKSHHWRPIFAWAPELPQNYYPEPINKAVDIKLDYRSLIENKNMFPGVWMIIPQKRKGSVLNVPPPLWLHQIKSDQDPSGPLPVAAIPVKIWGVPKEWWFLTGLLQARDWA